MGDQRYTWTVLQRGAIPLRPDGSVKLQVDYRCTTTLIWPDGTDIAPDNTVMVDPCFTDTGYQQAVQALDAQGAVLDSVGRVFVTHLHGDHMLHLPYHVRAPRFRSFRPESMRDADPLADITPVRCPGHDRGLIALTFRDSAARVVWVVGDAVLDAEWLRAWGYYYPNGYSPAEVVETWRSVARILAAADVVIPGHGTAFDVTPELLRDLLAAFPAAPYAEQCPDVTATLRQRLDTLESIANDGR